MKNLTYVTIVNENYKPYLEQLIKSHQLFSRIHLIIYTVNFDITKNPYKNIEFIRYTDNNLLEYSDTNFNKHIKNDLEKYKYTVLLKTKILQLFYDFYDYYFFIDCDGLLTKNSDVLFQTSINEFGFSKFPISTKYYYQYSASHNPNEPIFDEFNFFNTKSLSYYPLIELFGNEYQVIDYLTTYCIYYTKECLSFIKEAEEICFNENIMKDYSKYLPLGDETVFNYLYSKYGFSQFISSHLCFDINPFLPIKKAINNLNKTKNFVSYIHTKRYFQSEQIEKDFSNLRYDEYQQIFDTLLSNESCESLINIHDIQKNENSDVIFFSVGGDLTGESYVKIISLFRPDKEERFNITLSDEGLVFFIVKEPDVWAKDTNMIIIQDGIIKDVKKII